MQLDVAQERREPTRPVGHQLLEVDGLALGLERAGLDAAEAQQVRDEPVEAVDLVADRRQQLGSGRVVVDHAVAEVGGHRADRREWSAEVVGHGAQQRGALQVELLELFGSRRLAGELQLFAVRDFELLVECAHLLCLFADLFASTCEPRHELTDDECDDCERRELHCIFELVDLEGPVRLDVREVQRNRRDDRSRDRGPRAPDHCGDHHDEHQEQRGCGRGEVVAQWQQCDRDDGGERESDDGAERR